MWDDQSELLQNNLGFFSLYINWIKSSQQEDYSDADNR